MWLVDNGGERMDATRSDLFREDRRKFHLTRYNFALGYSAGRVVLDCACGTGYGTHMLAQNALTVVGMDINEEALEYARTYHGHHRALYQSTPPRPDTMDVVVSFETLEHVRDPEGLLAQFRKTLATRGDRLLILSTPNQWGTGTWHLHSWGFEDVHQLLTKAKFSILGAWAQNSGTMTSPHNHGKPAGLSEDFQNAECYLFVARADLS